MNVCQCVLMLLNELTLSNNNMYYHDINEFSCKIYLIKHVLTGKI